jgi:hypothetical protein
MRESEEYLESNSFWTDEGCYINADVVDIRNAEHAVKLAYKEGYLEARADILEELRNKETMFLEFALMTVRNMKLPENLFK